MNVKELIKILQTMKGTTPVCVTYDGHVLEVASVEVDEKQYVKCSEDQYGKATEVIILNT